MIKLKTLLCGPAGTLQPGLHTLDPDTEAALIRGGFAEPVGVPPRLVIETATTAPAETAALGSVPPRAPPKPRRGDK